MVRSMVVSVSESVFSGVLTGCLLARADSSRFERRVFDLCSSSSSVWSSADSRRKYLAGVAGVVGGTLCDAGVALLFGVDSGWVVFAGSSPLGGGVVIGNLGGRADTGTGIHYQMIRFGDGLRQLYRLSFNHFRLIFGL
uniref:Uncharacterized protein n=1 Tax=Anopheles atroparvus TaxID=41427 RepID=A0A182JBE5_ANOAO